MRFDLRGLLARRFRRAFVPQAAATLAAVIGTLAATSMPAGAQAASPPKSGQVAPAPTPPAADAKEPAGDAGARAPAEASVAGFRSASFGMSEADVRAAIAKDFPSIRPNQIKQTESPTEKTQILTIRVSDVIPGGGSADIGYIFGYKSKKLVQVTVVWSKSTDAGLTPDRIYANGTILRNYFVDAGYKAETVALDVPSRDGLLMFRGADAQGRTTVLMLQGTQAVNPENKDQRVLSPTGLVLAYLADPKAPDVFKLPPGQF